MSEHGGKFDALDFLRAVARRAHYEMSGKHGSPARAWIARLLFLWLVLAVDGPALWAGLVTIRSWILLVFGLFVVWRMLRWFFRRS